MAASQPMSREEKLHHVLALFQSCPYQQPGDIYQQVKAWIDPEEFISLVDELRKAGLISTKEWE